MTEDEIRNSWIYQTTGEINLHQPGVDIGTQPIRVVHALTIYLYQRTNPEFFNEILSGKGAGDNIDLVVGEEPITIESGGKRTPRVHLNTKKIELHETFLSYLWATIYSIFVLHSETIDYPEINARVGLIRYPISEANIASAKELFAYAKKIIRFFDTWDKETLPNPEVFPAENRHYVRQTCAFYTEAVKFILCHEYTHLRDHSHKYANADVSHFLEFEKEADNNAIDMMKKGITPINQLAVENGIIFGLLSMFFFGANTSGGLTHPNVEDRLINAIERLDLIDNQYPWQLAYVAFKLWDEQFELNLEWKNLPTYQEKFHDIILQIKQRSA